MMRYGRDGFGLWTVLSAMALLGVGELVAQESADRDPIGSSLEEVADVREVGRESSGPALGALARIGPVYPQDPADSLYRAARQALNRSEYRQAAEMFRRVREAYARSAYTADSYYWEAFALYRDGGSDKLRRALEALERQADRYPEAATRGDAAPLATRIRGELARLGDSDAAAQIAREAAEAGEVEQGAGAACPSEEQDTRIAALNALLGMDADRAVPILERVLARRDECSTPLRRKAVFLISRKETSRTADLLLEVARTDPDLEVKRQAVFWLSNVEDERAVTALEEVLRGAEDDEVRERALFALSRHDSERAGQILRDFARDPDGSTELRKKAIFWIGHQGSPDHGRFLRDLYGQIQDETLKEQIIFAVARMDDDPQASPWLLEVATDPDQPTELRKKAIFWAGQSGMPLSQLSQLYERMDDRELREQLIFALSRRDEPEAVDQLMEIARTESDLEVRKKAIFWLGRSDDPRVAEFLMRIIEEGGEEGGG